MTDDTDAVIVWGNCQAEPIADLLRAPLARHGLRVAVNPPVYLITADELARIHALAARCAALITQPVSDNYHLPGCGSSDLIARLRPGAQSVTLPVAFHVGPFPYQVHAHGGDGGRAPAPVTEYHDLRAIVAAANGFDVEATLRWWPAPGTDAVHAVRSASRLELAEREAGLDVQLGPALDAPGALWTMTHPTNRVLAELARAVLRRLGLEAGVPVPAREYLAERCAPIEAAVADAYGWPASAVRPDWIVRGAVVPQRELLAVQLDFYRDRPDVVADSLVRHATRIDALGLTP
jgi:hypothetical protein